MARRQWFDFPVTDTPLSASMLNDLEDRKAETEFLPSNVKDPPFNAVGNGVADDTAAIQAAMDALPDTGGQVYLPPGEYLVSSTLSVPKGCHLTGAGGTRNGNTTDHPFADTHLEFTNNGNGILVDSAVTSGWLIEGILLHGDPTLTSQDLLVIGTGTATFGGIVRDVTTDQAGRDGIVLNYALNVSFERVMARASTRHGWHFKSQSNANTLNRCYVGLSQQWGVYYDGGKDNTLNMVIESNSQASGTDYGGILVAAQSWGCMPTLIGCHFENNDGSGNTGVPLQVDVAAAHGGGPTAVTEIGSEYGEVNGVVLNDGQFTSIGLRTVETPHATIGAGHDGAVFVNPQPWGTATTFDITDSSGKSMVIGNAIVEGKPGIKAGDDTVLYRDAADTWRVADGDRIKFEDAVGNPVLEVRRAGEAGARFMFDRDGAFTWGSGGGAGDTSLVRDAAGNGLKFNNGDSLYMGSGTGTNQFIQFFEQTSDPAAPAADGLRVFVKDIGTKTTLTVRNATRVENIPGSLTGTATWDPGSIADQAMASTTVTVTGAAVGDPVQVGFSVAVPAGALMVGAVTAADTATVTLLNNTGSALDLASGTVRASVEKWG